MSNAPTKAKMTPSQHSELAQATTKSPQPFSPPAPSLAPKPPEIVSVQPVSLSQHLEISPPICVATLQLREIPGYRKNSKTHPTSKNSPYTAIFSSPTPSATRSNSSVPSSTTTSIETQLTMSIFAQKHQKFENSAISRANQTTPETSPPITAGPTNDAKRVYTSPPTPNDFVLQSPTSTTTASSSESLPTPVTPHPSRHKKSAPLRTVSKLQLLIESPASTTIVVDLKTSFDESPKTRIFTNVRPNTTRFRRFQVGR
jgi:hypothetical protein